MGPPGDSQRSFPSGITHFPARGGNVPFPGVPKGVPPAAQRSATGLHLSGLGALRRAKGVPPAAQRSATGLHLAPLGALRRAKGVPPAAQRSATGFHLAPLGALRRAKDVPPAGGPERI